MERSFPCSEKHIYAEVGRRQGREMGECTVGLRHLGEAGARCVGSIGCLGEDGRTEMEDRDHLNGLICRVKEFGLYLGGNGEELQAFESVGKINAEEHSSKVRLYSEIQVMNNLKMEWISIE